MVIVGMGSFLHKTVMFEVTCNAIILLPNKFMENPMPGPKESLLARLARERGLDINDPILQGMKRTIGAAEDARAKTDALGEKLNAESSELMGKMRRDIAADRQKIADFVDPANRAKRIEDQLGDLIRGEEGNRGGRRK
jgi:hypothetical protein